MAQRTEKEETEFEVVPETISLCVNNCGVTGNPTTNNMCQNCFNNATATTATTTAAAGVLKPIRKFKSGGERNPRSRPSRSSDPAETSRTTEDLTATPDTEAVATAKREVNRCSGCLRKVGLTGFRCRCGDLFCSEHRYSDRHDCSSDYRAAGREAIARENPLVRAAKIVRL